MVTLTLGVRVTWPVGSALKGYCPCCLDALADSYAGQLFRHGMLGPPAPAVSRQVPNRPAAPGSRPSRQRDQQDCVAAALDALLIRPVRWERSWQFSFPIQGTSVRKPVGTAGFEPATP